MMKVTVVPGAAVARFAIWIGGHHGLRGFRDTGAARRAESQAHAVPERQAPRGTGEEVPQRGHRLRHALLLHGHQGACPRAALRRDVRDEALHCLQQRHGGGPHGRGGAGAAGGQRGDHLGHHRHGIADGDSLSGLGARLRGYRPGYAQHDPGHGPAASHRQDQGHRRRPPQRPGGGHGRLPGPGPGNGHPRRGGLRAGLLLLLPRQARRDHGRHQLLLAEPLQAHHLRVGRDDPHQRRSAAVSRLASSWTSATSGTRESGTPSSWRPTTR